MAEPDLLNIGSGGKLSAPRDASDVPDDAMVGGVPLNVLRVIKQEAGANPRHARAIASEIWNRAQQSGESIEQVVMDPGQYGPGSPAGSMERRQWEAMSGLPANHPDIRSIAQSTRGILTGAEPPDGPWTFHYSPSAQASQGRSKPSWDDGSGTNIGGNLFFAHPYGGAGGNEPDLLTIGGGDSRAQPPMSAAESQLASGGVQSVLGATAQLPPGHDGGVPYGGPNAAGLEGKFTTPAAGRAWEAFTASPGYDPTAPLGTNARPYVLAEGRQAPEGSAYIDMAGQLHPAKDSGAPTGIDLTPNSLLAETLRGAAGGGRGILDAYTGSVGNAFGKIGADYSRDAAALRSGHAAAGLFPDVVGALRSDYQGQMARLAGRQPPAAPIGEGNVFSDIVGAGVSLTGLPAAVQNLVVRPGGSLLSGVGMFPNQQSAENAIGTGLMALGPETAAPAVAANPVLAAAGVAPRVAKVITRAIERDGLTVPDVIAAAKSSDAPAFHSGGPNLATLAETAAQTPGPAQTIVQRAVKAHQRAQREQVIGDVGAALGGSGDYLATLDRAIETRRTAANTGMAAIERNPVALTHDSILALRSDLAQGAINDAVKNGLASTNPAVRNAAAELARIRQAVLDNPAAARLTIRQAQDISYALKQASDAAWRANQGGAGEALGNLSRAIRDDARSTSPEYDNWLKQYGDNATNEAALELGHNIFSTGKGNTAAHVQKELDGMASEAARDNFRKGVAEALVDRARSSRGGVGTMRGLLADQDVMDKVRLAFPDQPSFDQFIASADRRVAQQETNTRVVANSRTYARDAAKADLEAEPLHPADIASNVIDVGGNLLTGSAGTLASKGLRFALSNAPRGARSVIAEPQANRLLGAALTDPDTLEGVLTIRDLLKQQRDAQRRARIGGPFVETPQGLLSNPFSPSVPNLLLGPLHGDNAPAPATTSR